MTPNIIIIVDNKMENTNALEINAAITLVTLRRNSVNFETHKKPRQNSENKIFRGRQPNKYQDVLTFIYQQYKYPDPHMYQNLSVILGLSIRQIQIWFQNRRARDSKKIRLNNKLEK
ncbi:homeobox [Bandra megavirus]|uniref:Homeobox n=1 Tax=Bandra megavirus TaxID=2071566 RepID=A0A2K9V7G6_9VIRU|nr:homeobox [Bandra megavirus]